MIKNLPKTLDDKYSVLFILEGLIKVMTDAGWENNGIHDMDWNNTLGCWFQKEPVTIYVGYQKKRYKYSGMSTRWERDTSDYNGVFISPPKTGVR